MSPDQERNVLLYSQAKEVLTNYFTGKITKTMKTRNISDKFMFSIQNGTAGSTSNAVRVALAAGNVDTVGFDIAKSSGEVTGITMHHHNPAALNNEGYHVDCILDDAAVTVSVNSESRTVTMATVDGSKTIRHALADLSRNFRCVKQITIAASSTRAYMTSMSIASLSPFHKENERDIDLQSFYKTTQYQNDKIEIPFQQGELQWNDSLFLALNVPGGVTEQITIEFYDEE